MNISVIIPIYNVEKYVERCILSIMNQTYTESVECIVVNDCTPDNGMKIVERLVADYKGTIQFKLFHHEHNKGIAAVRNTGLYAASGDYILYIDSDDYCEPDMLEKMYAKAMEGNADVVIADYWDTWPKKEIYMVQQMPGINENYAKYLFQGKISTSVWNKMIRRNVLVNNKLDSIEGINMGEDVLLIHRLFFLDFKVIHLSEAFYHYVHYNSTSYWGNISKKSLCDHLLMEKYLIDYYTKAGCYIELYGELCNMRMRHRMLLVTHSRGKLQKEWNSLYNNISLKDILKYSPSNKRLFLSLLVAMHMLPILNVLYWIKDRIYFSGQKRNLYTE